MAALARHSWPGNVRELQNFIERSVILSKGSVLNGSLAEPIYEIIRACDDGRGGALARPSDSSADRGVLGGPNGAAARLGLPRTTLIAKMKRLRINRAQNSALPVPAVASVACSEDPTLRIPPPSAIARESASSARSNPHSGVGRVYAVAQA
jgi:hypothetical protein